MGDTINCDSCGGTVEDGEHWVHVSFFHHNREGKSEKWSRDDPENDAYNLCPECGGDIEGMVA